MACWPLHGAVTVDARLYPYAPPGAEAALARRALYFARPSLRPAGHFHGRSRRAQGARGPPDRDGAVPLLKASRRPFPFIKRAFADSAYNAERVREATVIAIEVVKKLGDQVGFVVLPRRWVVERFFAWINRNRRLAKDFEATLASAETFLYAASVMLLTRRLARSK